MRIIESTHAETEGAKETLNVVLLSMQQRAAGIDEIKQEEKREIEQRSTYSDEKSGAVWHFKLNASTLETIHKATTEKLAAFDMKFNEESRCIDRNRGAPPQLLFVAVTTLERTWTICEVLLTVNW